jgi:2-succinyl-6-hydroxy-2,4-cyclohexadiene-1-carboxylate synthase
MALADSQWNKVVIVSASPGMTSEPEKEARIAADQTWAERFRTDTWTSVISDWNSQPVFASVQQDRLRREEAEYHRDHLAWALEQGSVGRQENLRRRLRAFEGQILWMAGERDRRYAALAEECASLHSGFQSCIIPDAGHRVPWESPVHFSREVLRFLAG